VEKQHDRALRTAGWLIGASAGAALLFFAGFAGAMYLRGPGWPALAFGVLSIVGALGLMDVARRRVVLARAELRIVSIWSQRVYSRDTIASVTWESGVGVALKLVSGGWVKLPELGRNSQSVANTIRAWLKQTRSGEPHGAGGR
jgi:hypothetical protein